VRQLIVGLQQSIGSDRFGVPELIINTTSVREHGQAQLGGKVFADWPLSKVRDEVAALTLKPFGKPFVASIEKLPHSRSLDISFSGGETLTLRLDQGVGYWRASGRSKAGPGALWFDFNNPDMVKQAARVSTMEAWVEGQIAPTLVFAKVRKARSVGQK
jgi:hypothetical protein